MKWKTHRCFSVMYAFFLLIWCAGGQSARGKTAYGVRIYDDGIGNMTDLVSFDPTDASVLTPVMRMGNMYVSAGVFANGRYYMAFAENAGGKDMPSNFFEVDLETMKPVRVGSLSGFDNAINDMSYDYSQGKLYAIARLNNGNSALYTLDLTYASSAKVVELDRHFYTLACSYGGQLYGVSRTGDFCKIDKTTGAVEKVGPTTIALSYNQSMEFDHSDRTLYWAVSAINEETFMARIDVKSGTAGMCSPLQNNAQIVGLYIPFNAASDEAPSGVTGFSVQADENGLLRATLSWTDPVVTFGGNPLASLERVDVYRNNEVIYTVENPEPGTGHSYTDEISGTTGRLVVYKIVPVNQAGNGVSTESEVYVGRDVPGTVGSLTLQKEKSDRIGLSWKAPGTGLHGGRVDFPSLFYRIIRLPDSTVIADRITATGWTDDRIPAVRKYRYKVIAVSSDGEGGEAFTEPYILGPELSLPYACSFETEEVTDTWTVINQNEDNLTWKREYYSSLAGYVMEYPFTLTQQADDWLISHAVVLEPGMTYKISFDVQTLGGNNIRFVLGKEPTAEGMNRILQEYEGLVCEEWETQGVEFTVEEPGSYHLGFELYSSPRNSVIGLTHVKLEAVMADDLAAVSLDGHTDPVAGTTYPYRFAVLNNGRNEQSRYRVCLINESDNETLAVLEPEETILPGETKEFVLSWTPEAAGDYSLFGKVVLEGDGQANDRTSTLAVRVRPEGSPEWIGLGVSGRSDRRGPFNYYYKHSAALNIYTAGEIGYEGGVIEKIDYTYTNNSMSEVPATPVKVYMTNTERTNAADGWIPMEDMTLVYEGNVALPEGKGKMGLPLDRYFMYAGGNLAVLTVKSLESGYYSGVVFPVYMSPQEGNRAYVYGDDDLAFDGNRPGTAVDNSAVTLSMACKGGKIRGIVHVAETPLSQAVVTLVERKTVVMSDEAGNYSFDYLPEGTYTLTCSRFGYPDVTIGGVKVEGRDSVACDIDMRDLKRWNVTGRVTDGNGNPLNEALVRLTGYSDYETKSDTGGYFSIGNVFEAEDYTLTISKDWYKEAERRISVTSDTNAGTIRLAYLVYAPVHVSAREQEDGSMSVGWQAPRTPEEFRTDDGIFGGELGLSWANEKTVFGTVYRVPTTVTQISWYTSGVYREHPTVNLFLFDLDEEGQPTSTELFSVMSVPNTDNEWNTYTLPQTVEAPRGFMVAVSYAGYLGIGTDSGEDMNYPFAEETHVFSSDYTSGAFEYIESGNVSRNLMLRAAGIRMAENRMKVLRAVETEAWKYKVWRLAGGTEDTPDAWSLLAEQVSDLTYTDAGWNGLSPAVYRYAVQTVYPDGQISSASLSPGYPKAMEAQITVRVNTNDASGSAEGAEVSLTHVSAGKTYAATVGTDGKAVFRGVWKGRYTIRIELPGYDPVTAGADFSLDDEYETEVFILRERIVAPFGPEIVDTENPADKLFAWNLTGAIFDDFESHTDFAINSPGSVGWQYLDIDSSETFAFRNFVFPGEYGKMAYIVFNPSATEPPMQEEVEAIRPYSGNKFLACFASEDGNNDFIISPKLHYAEEFQVSFMAKAYSDYEGYREFFNVGYSVEGTDPEDFTWIASRVSPQTGDWQEFAYSVPAEAEYVAINCISDNGFVLMIDDIRIGKKEQPGLKNVAAGPEFHYEVYLDGKICGTTTEQSFLFTGVTEGKHTAGVKSVYHSGSSGLITCEFNVTVGTDETRNAAIRLYPNPADEYIVAEGGYSILSIYNSKGQIVATFTGSPNRIDVSGFPEGLYLVKVMDESGRVLETAKFSILR